MKGETKLQDYLKEIQQEAASWPGVTASPHRFGGVEFNLGKAEIGHIHRGGTLDIPLPLKIRDQLLREGLVEKHHFLPDSGWITFNVRSDADLPRAVWLLRLSYLRYVLRKRSSVQSVSSNQEGLEELRSLNLSPELAAAFAQVKKGLAKAG
jgi:Luciferase